MSLSEPQLVDSTKFLYIPRTFTVQHANVTGHVPCTNVKPAHLKFQGQSAFDIRACSVQQLQLQLQLQCYKTALFRYSVTHIRTLTPDRRLRSVAPRKTGQVLSCISISTCCTSLRAEAESLAFSPASFA